MAKAAKKRDKTAKSPPKGRRKRSYGEFTKGQVVSMVMDLYYRQNLPQQRIVEILETRGVSFAAEAVRDCVREARQNGRLCYIPPVEEDLGSEILARRPSLSEVSVVDTAQARDVAQQGAQLLCQQMRHMHLYGGRDTIRIGFSGGRTPHYLAQSLSQMLCNLETFNLGTRADYPRKIVFTSLVASVDVRNPDIDPNSYSHFFMAARPALERLGFQLEFETLPGPGLVLRGEEERLRDIWLIKRAYEEIENRNFDCIVCSCGHFGDGHGAMPDHIESGCEGIPTLEEAWRESKQKLVDYQNQPVEGQTAYDREIVGDLAWCPLTRNAGPVPIDALDLDLFVFTVMRYGKLVRFAHPDAETEQPVASSDFGQGSVLLLVGPCTGETCTDSKGELLRSILQPEYPPVTHLVVDSRSARDYLAG